VKRALRWLVVAALSLAVLALAFDLIFPLPLKQRQFSAVVTADDGTPLRAFADKTGVWRYPVTLDDVSPRYVQALLTYEDRWFYRHPGINPFALLRAGWQWLRHGEIVSGGSTLSMQVARILDRHQRTVGGKLWQMMRALQLEAHLSKDEILTLYLNLAPFGGPLEGVQAASYAYLGRPAKELSHAEAALLAVLPQSPSRLRPDRHPQRARAARDKVIERLHKFGVWDEATARMAKQEVVISLYRPQPMLAPLFAQRFKQSALTTGALKTTLQPGLQSALEARLAERMAQMPEGSSAAVLVVENATLAVRAYLGSADFRDETRYGHVDMVRAQRSPGSTLKPFLYGFALDDGLIHSESLLTDAPQSFAGYRPGNFSGGFMGPVSAAEALQRSLNVPAVDLLDRLTPEKFAARLRNAGLKLRHEGKPNLALILGGAATTLEELVGAYTALARGGLAGAPRFTPDAPLRERRLLSPGAAWITRAMLEVNLRPDLPTQSVNWGGRRVAWKTGTSYGFRDAWAIGVTDRYTVGIWAGRPDGTPVAGHYGAATALPLLLEIVDSLPHVAADASAHRAPRPDTVKEAEICWPLGTAPDKQQPELCHLRRTAYILNGVVPPTLPDRAERVWAGGLQRYWINPKNGRRVDADCKVATRTARVLARWPAVVEPWLPRDIRRKAALPPVDPACGRITAGVPDTLHIAGMPPNSVVHRAGSRGVAASAPPPALTLSTVGGRGQLYWLINGELVQQTAPRQGFVYRFNESGRYEITVLDDAGSWDRVAVRVID
jgi:penicillin-binding protein 1C